MSALMNDTVNMGEWSSARLSRIVLNFEHDKWPGQNRIVNRILSLAQPGPRNIHINIRQTRTGLTHATMVAAVRLSELDRKVIVVSSTPRHYADTVVFLSLNKDSLQWPLSVTDWETFVQIPVPTLIRDQPVIIFDQSAMLITHKLSYLSSLDCAFCNSGMTRKPNWIDKMGDSWGKYLYEDERQALIELARCLLRYGFSFGPSLFCHIVRYVIQEEYFINQKVS